MRQSSDGRGRAEDAERARNAEASAQRAGPCHARDILVAARAAGEGPHMWGLTAITSRRKRPTHNHRGLRQQCREAEARAAGEGPRLGCCHPEILWFRSSMTGAERDRK